MKRKIITINEEKCNGCGLCVEACHEGAIGLVDGKARLLRDDYCDGLGNCLPVCPTGAITFEEREALAFNQEAVEANLQGKAGPAPQEGCPGSRARRLRQEDARAEAQEGTSTTGQQACPSQLRHWPVQLKLVPANAPYFQGAHLLIAADCTAYACGDFHRRFMKGKVVLIGCPKLDEGSYAPKLTEILKENHIQSVTILRMEVPCCGGLAQAATTALEQCGKEIPWQVVTLTTEGDILESYPPQIQA